jgi:MFS transporter, DHA1 family, inner membrane transport protein
LTALAIWFAGLGAAAQFGKLSVIFGPLGEAYAGEGAVGLGLMVSIIGIVGLIFGTTAGVLVARIGSKRAMLAALLLGAAISLIQSFHLPFGWMLISRIPEGFSHLTIVVVGPTAIAATANLRFQGLVMTLWGSFFGLTFTVLALAAPVLVASYGIGALFQLHALWLGMCFVLLWVLMPKDRAAAVGLIGQGVIAQHLRTYRSARIAAPAFGFVCYTVTYVATLTLLPGAVSPDWSHSTAVAMPLISILVSLTLGVALLSVLPAVRVVQLGFAVVGLASLGLWATWGQGAFEFGFACLIAAAMGTVQGASFAAIPQLNASLPDRAAAAGAIAQLGNLGTTTGTPLLALILAQAGIAGLSLFLLGFSLLGIALHHWLGWRRLNG